MNSIPLVLAALALATPAFGQVAQSKSKPTPANTPTFTLAWSEYPSWSAFDVASTYGIIDGRKGYMSATEEKYGVDVELKLLDYDPCIQGYASGTVDAVCITNTDILSPSLTRKSVAIIPTSTSFGGDALIVPKTISSWEDLKGQTVFGLGKSVSEYGFVGLLEANKATGYNITFTNMDPGAASTAAQQNDAKVKNIFVWNPFMLQTLKNRKDMHVLGNSRQIPLEIVDMVVVGEDTLNKKGGEAFAKCLADGYYQLNVRLNDPSTRDETLIAIGEKFSSLGLADMRKVVDQTRFFGTAEAGIDLFSNNPVNIDSSPKTTFREVMDRVVARCVKLEMVDKKVTVAYGSDSEAKKANIRFDPQYMIAVAPAATAKSNPTSTPVTVPVKDGGK